MPEQSFWWNDEYLLWVILVFGKVSKGKNANTARKYPTLKKGIKWHKFLGTHVYLFLRIIEHFIELLWPIFNK